MAAPIVVDFRDYGDSNILLGEFLKRLYSKVVFHIAERDLDQNALIGYMKEVYSGLGPLPPIEDSVWISMAPRLTSEDEDWLSFTDMYKLASDVNFQVAMQRASTHVAFSMGQWETPYLVKIARDIQFEPNDRYEFLWNHDCRRATNVMLCIFVLDFEAEVQGAVDLFNNLKRGELLEALPRMHECISGLINTQADVLACLVLDAYVNNIGFAKLVKNFLYDLCCFTTLEIKTTF